MSSGVLLPDVEIYIRAIMHYAWQLLTCFVIPGFTPESHITPGFILLSSTMVIAGLAFIKKFFGMGSSTINTIEARRARDAARNRQYRS